MTGAQRPDISDILPGQIWESLFQQTLRFATYQVNRLHWRGHTDGLLPDGYDPNSMAAQAILEFLQQNLPGGTRSTAVPPRSTASHIIESPLIQSKFSRLAVSPSPPREERAGERLPFPRNPLSVIQFELNRLVLKHVTRLYHRKENFVLCPAEDLVPVLDMDEEFVSALELIPGPDIQPDEALLQKESTLQFYELKHRFEAVLPDQPLRTMLELGCDGVSKPKALAAKLKLPVQSIYHLRVRLQRAWRRFMSGRSTRK